MAEHGCLQQSKRFEQEEAEVAETIELVAIGHHRAARFIYIAVECRVGINCESKRCSTLTSIPNGRAADGEQREGGGLGDGRAMQDKRHRIAP